MVRATRPAIASALLLALVACQRERSGSAGGAIDTTRPSVSPRSFIADIDARTSANTDFRRVLFTGPHLQLVLMSLEPGVEIGQEVHDHTDQFFRVESGTGVVSVNGVDTPIGDGTGIVIPAGTRHNIKNTGSVPLRLYTLYAPPEHADGIVRHTKADAEREPEHFAR